MKNDYALFEREGLAHVDRHLASASEEMIDHLRSLLRIGLHWGVGLTDVDPGPTVSQAFCSALPVSYNRIAAASLWSRFASLILEAAYEATLRAGWLSAARGASNRVFLTRLGGGAFGNDTEWIDGAMRRALQQAGGWRLDVPTGELWPARRRPAATRAGLRRLTFGQRRGPLSARTSPNGWSGAVHPQLKQLSMCLRSEH